MKRVLFLLPLLLLAGCFYGPPLPRPHHHSVWRPAHWYWNGATWVWVRGHEERR